MRHLAKLKPCTTFGGDGGLWSVMGRQLMLYFFLPGFLLGLRNMVSTVMSCTTSRLFLANQAAPSPKLSTPKEKTGGKSGRVPTFSLNLRPKVFTQSGARPLLIHAGVSTASPSSQTYRFNFLFFFFFFLSFPLSHWLIRVHVVRETRKTRDQFSQTHRRKKEKRYPGRKRKLKSGAKVIVPALFLKGATSWPTL